MNSTNRSCYNKNISRPKYLTGSDYFPYAKKYIQRLIIVIILLIIIFKYL